MGDIDPRMAAPPSDEHPSALRLIFVYEGDDVRLVSRLPVDVVVQQGDPVERGERSGFWVELRAANEEVLYRRVLTDPARVHPEVFSPDPEVGITRAPEPQPAGAFTVLVPRQERGSHVVLMSSPPRPGATTRRLAASQEAPAQEIGRFPLDPAASGEP